MLPGKRVENKLLGSCQVVTGQREALRGGSL